MKDQTFLFITKSASQTEKIAFILGQELGSSLDPDPIIIGLVGDLGAGKTTFVKGLAKGLGVDETVSSPTFILIARHESKRKILYHVDPYRLTDEKSIVPDLKELLSQKNAVIAIEWAGRFSDVLPKDTIWVVLEHRGKDKREISISNYEERIKGVPKL